MEKLVIEGGVPLSGTIVPAGNKNAALPLLAASLLTDERVVLANVPRIRDTEAMLALLADLGVTVEWIEDNTVSLQADGIEDTDVDPALAERIRASFLVAGPLLARFGSASMPPPGGDVIGRRRLDPHLDAFRALGADVELGPPHQALGAQRRPALDRLLHGRAVRDGHGERAHGRGADPRLERDPQRRLRAARAGPRAHAQQDGRGDRGHRLERHVRPWHGQLGGCEHAVSPDHIEIASFMALAGVTGGELRIRDCVPEDMRMICLVFERLGLHSTWDGADILVPGGQKLVVARDAGDYQSKVEDGPWPAFPADLTSIAVALATQSEGSVLIFEKMFENRLFFVDKLISMGAEITICDPHRAIVIGPRRLRGARLSSPDIRAGMAILIAALCADGAERDPQRARDRPRLRADRRAPARPRRSHRARRDLI